MKANVLILTNSLGYGGAERVISLIYPKLSEKYNMHLALLVKNETINPVDGNIILLGKEEKSSKVGYIFDLAYKIYALRRFIEEQEIDVVLSFLPVPDLLNIIFCKKAKRIISVRGQIENGKNKNISSLIKYYLRKKLYRKSDGAIVVSESLRDSLIRKYSFSEKKIRVIYNPFIIDEMYKKSEEKLDEKLEDIFINNKVIVSVGRVVESKGFQYLIKAFERAFSEDDKIKLIIVGEGEYLEYLNKYVIDHDLEKRVLLVGGKKNPYNYLKRATLFAFPSLTEGFPNALVEAMCFGIPVVSTDCVSGPREILYGCYDKDKIINDIEYADYGILIPCFNNDKFDDNKVDILAKVLSNCMCNEKLLLDYGKKAKERASFFTLEKCVHYYCNFIDGYINQ